MLKWLIQHKFIEGENDNYEFHLEKNLNNHVKEWITKLRSL